MNVPFWNAIIHDWQKFTPTEWRAYALSFYGPWDFSSRPDWLIHAFDIAWLHHQHYGQHHWQHWILREDSGGQKILEMPDKYRKEMVADWRGASRAITGGDNTRSWYMENRNNIQLHPRTKAWVELTLGISTGPPALEAGSHN